MIAFTILVLSLIAAAIILCGVLAVGGTAFILVFGDVIVLVLIVIGIVKLLRKKSK